MGIYQIFQNGRICAEMLKLAYLKASCSWFEDDSRPF